MSDQLGLTPETSAALRGMKVAPSGDNAYVTEADMSDAIADAIAGIPGGGGGTGEGYVHNQGAPASTWVVTHALSFYPNVTVVDSAGTVVVGNVHYDSPTQLTLTFSAPFSGKAYLS